MPATKMIAVELAGSGTIEPIVGKRDAWRTTNAGVAADDHGDGRECGSAPLDGFLVVDRGNGSPVRVTRALACGGNTTGHQRIQDIENVEIAVVLEPTRGPSSARTAEAICFLQRRGWTLKVGLPGLMDADRHTMAIFTPTLGAHSHSAPKRRSTVVTYQQMDPLVATPRYVTTQKILAITPGQTLDLIPAGTLLT